MSDNAPLQPVRKAVFPVAGLGTRFLPATKAIPKEMLTLVDRPLIQHAVEEARDAGIEEFIFVTSPNKSALTQHFEPAPELEAALEKSGKTNLLEKVRQSNIPEGMLLTCIQEEALGLGHAVWCARDLVGDEPFAVMLADDVVLGQQGCLSQMMDRYSDSGGNMVAVMDVPREDTAKYGILDTPDGDQDFVTINGLVEKPKPEEAPSTLSIIGRYILQPEIFDHLAAFETGAGGEIQLTDAMAKLIGSQPFHGLRFSGTRFDCGSRRGFIEANIAYGLQDPEIAPELKKMIDAFTSGGAHDRKTANG